MSLEKCSVSSPAATPHPTDAAHPCWQPPACKFYAGLGRWPFSGIQGNVQIPSLFQRGQRGRALLLHHERNGCVAFAALDRRGTAWLLWLCWAHTRTVALGEHQHDPESEHNMRTASFGSSCSNRSCNQGGLCPGRGRVMLGNREPENIFPTSG